MLVELNRMQVSSRTHTINPAELERAEIVQWTQLLLTNTEDLSLGILRRCGSCLPSRTPETEMRHPQGKLTNLTS